MLSNKEKFNCNIEGCKNNNGKGFMSIDSFTKHKENIHKNKKLEINEQFSFTRPPNQPFSGPSNQPFGGPPNQPFGGPPNQPFSGPLNQPFSGPLNQPFSALPNQPFSGPLNQPFGGPPNQPFGGPSNQPFSAPPNQPFSDPPNQPFSGPPNQPLGGSLSRKVISNIQVGLPSSYQSSNIGFITRRSHQYPLIQDPLLLKVNNILLNKKRLNTEIDNITIQCVHEMESLKKKRDLLSEYKDKLLQEDIKLVDLKKEINEKDDVLKDII